MGSISFVANTRSLISMAWLWCGVIIEANITSASLCGPDAGVAAAGLDGVLDVAGEVTEPLSWSFIDEPQPARINKTRVQWSGR